MGVILSEVMGLCVTEPGYAVCKRITSTPSCEPGASKGDLDASGGWHDHHVESIPQSATNFVAVEFVGGGDGRARFRSMPNPRGSPVMQVNAGLGPGQSFKIIP
ncbi:hypothetical protein KRMM14A1004_16120 [Krasilnikovia sp. MM14-A1004]